MSDEKETAVSDPAILASFLADCQAVNVEGVRVVIQPRINDNLEWEMVYIIMQHDKVHSADIELYLAIDRGRSELGVERWDPN